MNNSLINTVGKFLIIFPAFVFMLNFSSALNAQKIYQQPDFAFPQRAEQGSQALMKESLEKGDHIMALRGAMNLVIARNELQDSESVQANVALLDSLSIQFDGLPSRLALLIEAEILRQDYTNKSYIYNERNLPLDSPFPLDPSEWSGEMFKFKILELVDNATKGLKLKESRPISEIQVLLSNYETAEKIGFTIEDFIIFTSVSLLRNFAIPGEMTVIPFYPVSIDQSVDAKAREKVKSLLDWLLAENRDKNSVVSALSAIEYTNFLEDYERSQYLERILEILKGREGESLILYKIWETSDKVEEKQKELYSEIENWLKKYPDGVGSDQLKYAKSMLAEKRIDITMPSCRLPEEDFEITAELKNTEKGYLLIYKLQSGEYDRYDNLILKKFSGNSGLVRRIEISGEGTVPFKSEQKIKVAGLPSGLYAVIPSTSKNLSKGWNKSNYSHRYSTIRISDISIVSVVNRIQKDSGKLYVVKSKNQEPVAGAKVSCYKEGTGKLIKKLVTDKDGSITLPEGYYQVEASNGKNIAKSNVNFNYNSPYYPESRHLSILTDLSIYRPGDKVEFVVLGWSQNKEGNQLIKGEEIEVTFRDANFKKIGDVKLTLDNKGIARSALIIPEGKLLGSYSLMASFIDKPEIACGSTAVEVAEYKLPPFQVIMEQSKDEKEDLIKFKGFARTYSGMPIVDAPVRIKVCYYRWNRGWFNKTPKAEYLTTLATSKEGAFELQLPTSRLKGTMFETGSYSVTAEVVSSTGEQVSSPALFFFLGEKLSMEPQIPDKIEIKGDSICLHVPVYDMAHLPEKKEVNYKITNIYEGRDTLKGSFISPILTLDSSLIESGRYKIEFYIKDEENSIIEETTFWRQKNVNPPYPTPLWVPEKEYAYTPDSKDISVRFGSYWQDWILCVVSGETGIIEQKWIATSDSLIDLNLALRNKSETYFVELLGMHDFNSVSERIKIVPTKDKDKMTVSAISFRDNITANTNEKWSFRFRVNDQIAKGVNAFAVMSDKALNSLNNFRWEAGIYFPNAFSNTTLNYISITPQTSFRVFTSVTPYRNRIFNIPQFESYGYPWVSGFYQIYSPVMYKSASRTMATNALKGEYETAKVAVMDTAEDSVELEMEESDDNADNGSSGNPKDQEGELMRPIEMPLAFFKTDLHVDNEGILDIDFKVPDFNTTWQLQIFGYNEDLLNAGILLDAVASKKVMVKSNLPQYVRCGDKASVSALLFNNSTDTLSIGGRIVIVDPANGRLIAERQFEEPRVEPSGSRLISMKFTVGPGSDMLAVRCYALSEENSDGEQGYFPVFPSDSPVIESTLFYAGIEDEMIELKLPKFKKEANVTLKYCDNPLWETLLALPLLQENQNGSALSVVRNLYATMMAYDIVNSHKEIADDLERILTSEDTTLTISELQKDEQFKTVALEATPWVNNAENETHRIRSLGQYLNQSKVENLIEQTKSNLKKMQGKDGGWSWFEGFHSSPYITSEVVSILGFLGQANLLDEDLKIMASNGAKFYEKWLVLQRNRKMELPVMPCLLFLYSCDNIGFSLSKEMREIKREILSDAKEDWRYWNMAQKSLAAMVMLGEREYETEAMVIIESIKEYLNRQHSLFEEAWALILFNELDPEGESTAKLRELLYLKKETEDWGSNPYTAGIIHALIVSTPLSNYERELPEVYIGTKQMSLPETEAMTGNFTIDINAKEMSGKRLVIKRKGGVPAWGGVISQFVKPIKEVKSESVEDLKIEKRIYLIKDDGKAVESTSFKKGDKVEVVLTLTCQKDMDYVALTDNMGACLLPEEQISGLTFIDGLLAYKEIRKATTSFFIENLPAGKYVISYECKVEREGEYALGIANVQSLYSPTHVAHSKGQELIISEF